jgi:hypothetical protein
MLRQMIHGINCDSVRILSARQCQALHNLHRGRIDTDQLWLKAMIAKPETLPAIEGESSLRAVSR